ncbi:MAG: hypothetical protein JW947_02860 [Sedimentisphaerales bacterium]|nr:hypothetical protein [Sedimentisphaerales bacterium]
MELSQEHRQEIEKIAGGIKCPKGFRCYKSDSKKLCEARDFGMERYLYCLVDEAQECDFSLSYGRGYLCTCPVRIYIAKNLGQ